MNCMVDIETFGTSSSACIESIGAVMFNEIDIHDAFHKHIDFNSVNMNNYQCDGKTIVWWLGQSQFARQPLIKCERHPLRDILVEFNYFIKGHKFIIAKGSHFDIPIILNAYKVEGIEPAFSYKDVIDLRTLMYEHPDARVPEKTGVLHNALDDATNQATWMMENYDKVRTLF